MSRSAVSAALERIDGIVSGGGADVRLEAVAVHDIDGAVEQARNVILEPRIVEHGQMGVGIDLDHDIDVAVRTRLAPRNRAENGRAADATGAQIRFGSAKGLDGLASIHSHDISTKLRAQG